MTSKSKRRVRNGRNCSIGSVSRRSHQIRKLNSKTKDLIVTVSSWVGKNCRPWSLKFGRAIILSRTKKLAWRSRSRLGKSHPIRLMPRGIFKTGTALKSTPSKLRITRTKEISSWQCKRLSSHRNQAITNSLLSTSLMLVSTSTSDWLLSWASLIIEHTVWYKNCNSWPNWKRWSITKQRSQARKRSNRCTSVGCRDKGASQPKISTLTKSCSTSGASLLTETRKSTRSLILQRWHRKTIIYNFRAVFWGN